MNQLSKAADEQLNRLSRKIADGEELIEKGTVLKDEGWVEVLYLFDEFGLEGPAARFIASDGTYLYRQPYQKSPVMDEALLYKLLFTRYTATKAKRLWEEITDRRVNSTKVEQMIQSRRLDAALVAECITIPEPTFSRIRKEWTKQDTERAQILGIKKEES